MLAAKALLTIFALWASSAAAACACTKVSDPGLYCWYCPEVKSGWKVDRVYECSKTGKCSEYAGKSSKCADLSKYYCDGRDSWKRDPKAIEEIEARRILAVESEE